MKNKYLLTGITALLMSATAFASVPGSYDTKFNISANVPDSATITDGSGRPITDLDSEMVPAPSGKMESATEVLKLWNNDKTKLAVTLKLDDSQAADNDPFTLYTSQGNSLSSLTYKVHVVSSGLNTVFTKSGESKPFMLVANGEHGELPVRFKFISDKAYKDLPQGHYSGVIYANLSVAA